jgi:DNA-binding MarR family transcriptional regulator
MRATAARGPLASTAANRAVSNTAAGSTAADDAETERVSSGSTMHPMPHMAGIDYGLLDSLVGYGVRRAQLAIYDDFIRSLAQWDITPPRFSALVIIGNNPGLKLTDLANVLAVARSGAVILADTLEARGLVERRDSATDRRAWGLHLTRAGRALLEKTTRAVREQDERVSATLTAVERDTLLRLLRKVARLDRQE